ncbi:MAG: ABC transporter substrate-binding protein [Proteobacteria bacterium]|nr:ABC transporter substrate-binding protein [Pseudomonadota bacterium]
MPAAATSRRRLLFLGLGAVALLGSGGARAEADPAIVGPIKGLYDSLITVMKAGDKTPFAQRYDTLAPAIDRALDLPAILQVSVGPAAWNTLPPDQQAALLDAFRRYTISLYVSSFNNFNGQKFTIEPDLRTVGNDQIVQTKIVPASGDSHELDYVMRQVGGDWKAVDVLSEGAISRVATQRSDFRALLARGGGPALLASLQQKTNDLSGGRATQ